MQDIYVECTLLYICSCAISPTGKLVKSFQNYCNSELRKNLNDLTCGALEFVTDSKLDIFLRPQLLTKRTFSSLALFKSFFSTPYKQCEYVMRI